MGELVRIFRYDLTGGPAAQMPRVRVGRAGINGDQQFLLYDAGQKTPDKLYLRRGRAEFPALAQLYLNYEAGYLSLVASGELPYLTVHEDRDAGSRVMISEFGDRTPCVDMGDAAAGWFSAWLGVEGLRLARKQKAWQAGKGGIEPSSRSNAALQIVSAEILHSMSPLRQQQEFGTDQLRPNFAVEGLLNLNLDTLAGRSLRIGQLVTQVLPPDRHGPQPEIGVFAVPVLPMQTPRPWVGVGDPVTILA